MAGIIDSTSPCVQVVDTYLHFFYNAPALPGTTGGSNGQVPFSGRSMYVFKVLISCPGIWDLQNTSFTYTNIHGETAAMTMVDFNNSLPLVLPENETIEIELAWDFFWDGVLGIATLSSLPSVVQYALNYCVSLQYVPFNGSEPPPPPPGSSMPDPYEGVIAYPLPEEYIPTNNDPGTTDTSPEETPPTGTGSGETPPSNSGGSTESGATNPSDYDPQAEHDPQTTVPNIALADMYRLNKYDVGGKFLGDFRDRQRKPGDRPSASMQDRSTKVSPVAGIGEPREVYFTQLYNKSSLKEKGFSPGQSFVPRVKKSDAVDGLIYEPNRKQILGKKNVVKGTVVSNKSPGNRVNIKSTASNPNIDVRLKESHGANYSVDNFNNYVTKDPKAGSRVESLPIYNYRADNKVDSNGRPVKTSQNRKDGAASSSPKASFNLFSTRIPKDKVRPFISRRSTRQLAQTSGTEGYSIPLANNDFTIVDDSNVIYNGGQGLFYGVGPFETVESDEFLQGIYNVIPTKDNIITFVTVNDSSIVESNLVTPATIGIQNNSFHKTEHNTLIVLGILDSEFTFRYIGYNYINIVPRSYQFMTAIIPPGLPPGAAKVVGMIFNSNNELIMSEIENIIIAPDGYTVEGYTPYSPYLPASLSDLAGSPSIIHGGRVFENISKRRYKATSNTVDIIAKSPQIAISRGLDSKITTIYENESDVLSTSSSTSRYTIDGVEVFPGSHDVYLQIQTASGNTVDVTISDALDRSHASYAYNSFASNLEVPSLTFSGIANESGYLGGHIQTNVINGRVVLENARNSISTTRLTTESGFIILNTTGGWNQTGDVVTQVDPTETPYLGFNSLPGDTINIYAEGIGGNYDDLIVQNTLLPDTQEELPTIPYTLPEDAYIPFPLGGVGTAGDTIPDTGNDPDPPLPPGAGDNDDPPPPPNIPPGQTNGECSIPAGEEDTWKVQIVSVCQRPSNPCILDIVVDLHTCDEDGNPVGGSNYYASIVNELSSFSIDSTNGIDGNWYQLVPLTSDGQHSADQNISLPGTCNFVADMCDHFSDFFSTNSIMFKLVFRIGEQGAAGGFLGNCTLSEILTP